MNHFVTGATGLVGQRLVEELLARSPSCRVYALVRPESVQRMDRLRATWRDGDRVEPVVGDLSRPGLGIETPPPAIDHFFHVAARYHLALDERTAFLNNILGTLHAIQLANDLGVQGFHYTSSIGVAGRFAGRFMEDMGDEGQLIDNHYFASKLRAETVIRSMAKVPFAIHRLGVVVGDSETGRMTKEDGAYHFFPMVKFLSRLPAWLRVPGPEGGFANLVPVDFVARAMCEIAELPPSAFHGEVFHVVDGNPLRVGQAINSVLASERGPQLKPLVPLNVTRKTRVAQKVPGLYRLRRRVLRAINLPEEVVSWRDFDAFFDTTRIDKALEGSGVSCPPFDTYAPRLYRYWRDHLDPQLPGARLGHAVAGRRVLLTGASRGIGRSLAELLAHVDCTLVIVSRDRDELARVAQELSGHAATIVPLACDLAERDEVQRLIDEVTLLCGGIDILINNAGKSIRRGVAFVGGRLHDYDRTMAVNYFAPAALTLGLLPGMQSGGHGHVVNISSIGLQTNMSRFSAYNASKAALDAFVRSLAPEVWNDGVRFSTVYLPLVRTAMSAPTTPFRRLPSISSDEAARLVARALRTRQVRVSTPLGTFGLFLEAVAPTLVRHAVRGEHALLPESEASIRSAPTNWLAEAQTVGVLASNGSANELEQPA